MENKLKLFFFAFLAFTPENALAVFLGPLGRGEENLNIPTGKIKENRFNALHNVSIIATIICLSLPP